MIYLTINLIKTNQYTFLFKHIIYNLSNTTFTQLMSFINTDNSLFIINILLIIFETIHFSILSR